MRSRTLLQWMASETGIPDYSNPKATVWRNAQGQLHRDFGPAITYADGSQFWYRNDHLHRLDGPAITSFGTRQWLINDKRHREDGPAFVAADGSREWWVNGQFARREDGPEKEP